MVDNDVAEEGPLSYDGLAGSSEGLLGSNDMKPRSSDGRVYSCLEEVEGLEGGDGGAAPLIACTLL